MLFWFAEPSAGSCEIDGVDLPLDQTRFLIGMGRPASRWDGALGLRRPGNRGAGGQRPASESGTDKRPPQRPSPPRVTVITDGLAQTGLSRPIFQVPHDSQHHFWLSIKMHCPGRVERPFSAASH